MSKEMSEQRLIRSLKTLSKLVPNSTLKMKARGVFQLANAVLFQYGWLRSCRQGKPVDADGNAIPWITYPCIDFLKQLNFQDKSVFEWGAGQSTLFWSARAKKVVSVEADPEWYEMVKCSTSSNCEVRLTPRELDSYVGIIDEYQEEFDVISIDGPGDFRIACSEVARKYLKRGGFVLLDNSDQSLKSAKVLRDAGLLEVDFTGFVPGVGYPHTTSMFFDRAYCFQALNGIQPQPSVAQPNLPWSDA